MPARLSRQHNNLAEPAIADLLAGVGMYSGLTLQGLSLHGPADPGPVALIIDQHVEHIVDVSLAELEAAGVDLLGVRLHWQHTAGCACAPAERGDVGRFLGGDTSGMITTRDAGGDTQSVPAACVAVQANRGMMAKYVARAASSASCDALVQPRMAWRDHRARRTVHPARHSCGVRSRRQSRAPALQNDEQICRQQTADHCDANAPARTYP